MFSIGSALATTTIIDDGFDSPTVSDWVSQGNGRTFSAHNITASGSVLSSEVVATQTNTHRGIVSTVSFDPDAEAGGFSMTYVVDTVAGTPGANGYFIGLVNAGDAFFRDASLSNFGLTFFGQDARTGSANGFGLIYGDNNGTGSADFQLANSNAQGDVQLASLQDGFSATVTGNPSGWSYTIDGLSTAAGSPTSFSDAGTWAAAGTDYATLFGADDSWFATASLQQEAAATHTVGYDRITLLTIPEPSSALLLAAAAACGLLRRRRRR